MLNKSIKTLSPAKINWFLNVGDSMPDGYHQLQTFMQKISLYDIIHLESVDEDLIKFCDTDNKCFCPPEENIIVKAANKLKRLFNINSGINISIQKNIPVCAGLGGGSSNAASVLKALIKIWKIKISDNELNQIAASLGADVPFFLNTIAGLCEGIGEKIFPVQPKKHFLVLWNPGLPLATADVYKRFDCFKRKEKKSENFLSAYSLDDFKGIKDEIWNNLALAAEELLPILKNMRDESMESGAEASWVSGSGPTIVSLCKTERSAKNLAYKLMENYPDDFIYQCETISIA